MTNVSRSKTNTKFFKSLYKELADSIASLDKKSSLFFIEDLFTETERIMIIKRFSAILLFSKGYSPYKVWNLLHISPTTANKLHLQYKIGKYDRLVKSIQKSELPLFITFLDKLIKSQGKERWILID